jgi:hypothetical protein
MEDNLKHRFYPLHLDDSDNSMDGFEPGSRPQRVPRALCLLGGFDDAEYGSFMLRRQDLFKSSQACERARAVLTRKEKDVKVKLVMA